MRIAFVSANIERLPDPVVPLGLLSVMASTPAHHSSALVDLCFEDDPVGALRSALAELRPAVVAMGIRNLQTSLYSGMADNLRHYGRLAEVIREGTAIFVLGGAGFSVMPEALMALLGADLGVAGEGEGSFAALLVALEGGDLRRVPGLYRQEGGRVVRNAGAAPFEELGRLPLASRRLVDPRYYAETGTDSVQTRRGCALHCRSCTYPRIEGRQSRLRDPSAVLAELCASREAQPEVAHHFFVDSVFTRPSGHAAAVCEALIDARWDLPWTCYGNPIGFDRGLARAMVRAGCAGMEIGIDSGDDGILHDQRKGFDAAAIRRMHAIAADEGLATCPTLLLGLEGESDETLARSLDLLHEIEPTAAILMLYTDEQEALDPELARTAEARRARLGERVSAACRREPRWIAPQLGIHYSPSLFASLRRSGRRGPLWQHLPRRSTAPR